MHRRTRCSVGKIEADPISTQIFIGGNHPQERPDIWRALKFADGARWSVMMRAAPREIGPRGIRATAGKRSGWNRACESARVDDL